MTQFKWTRKREAAALALAEGYTEEESAQRAGVSRSSITRWKRNVEFGTEVDRLSLMVGVASSAERLRIAQRAIRQFVQEHGIKTKRDLLDWMKFAQSETDGAQLNLALVFEAMEGATEGDGSGDG